MNCIPRCMLILLVAISVNTQAGGVHHPASSALLERLLSPLTSLRATFSQTVTDGEGYELQAVTGTMTVARPGMVHWRTDPPYEQLVVSDATTLWLYDQDLEQVTVRPFSEDIARTPAVLLIGKVENLHEKYRVSSVEKGSNTEFTLVPLDEGSLYQKISLSFAGDIPQAMSLWDTLGQKTAIDFSGVAINQPVDETLFTFIVPHGVDVLYDD